MASCDSATLFQPGLTPTQVHNCLQYRREGPLAQWSIGKVQCRTRKILFSTRETCSFFGRVVVSTTTGTNVQMFDHSNKKLFSFRSRVVEQNCWNCLKAAPCMITVGLKCRDGLLGNHGTQCCTSCVLLAIHATVSTKT